jgi:hypothetical protein
MKSILNQIKQSSTSTECVKNIKDLNILLLESVIDNSLILLKIGGLNILMFVRQQFRDDLSLNV